jgi:hypothetical protein
MPFHSGLSLFEVVRRYRGFPTPQRKTQPAEEIFKCSDCGKNYKSRTSLSLHQRLECGKEPKFSCPFCPKKCHQKGNLKVHIHSKHKTELMNGEGGFNGSPDSVNSSTSGMWENSVPRLTHAVTFESGNS